MTKLRKFVSKDISKSLYFTFVQPNIDYGILWGTAINSATKKIKQNLKKAVRKILFKSYSAQSEPLFRTEYTELL